MSTLRDALTRADAGLARTGTTGRGLAVLGGLAAAGSAFLRWTYDPSFGGDLTLSGSPGGSQWWTLVLGLLTAAGAVLAARARPGGAGRVAGATRATRVAGAARAAAGFGLVLMVLTAVEITVSLGGTANLAPGAWLGLAGALLAAVGSRALTGTATSGALGTPSARRRPPLLEAAVVVAGIAACVYLASVLLGQAVPVLFIALAVFVAGVVVVLRRLGVTSWFSVLSGRHRTVTAVAALAGAAVFPFTQHGNDTNMSIAYQILVFASAAIGLNIVIGYAGLLDLGYVAFVGAGAYTAAILSGAPSAPSWWHPPFLVAFLLGGLVSSILGVLIGLPTLRLRGDYLAIVTLAFGEIFHTLVNNLDGASGPSVTGGSNGIFAIGSVKVGGFDFDTTHRLFGVPITLFSNYYFLLLVLVAAIVFAVGRVSRSRIGRAWVAIREDETAAEAMGISTYRLKLLAFAGGALLAGFGGAIRPHVDTAVAPDSYVFEQSTLLVAAVVLGGMGNIPGVILGSTVLALLPEKLRFLQDHRLLVFGLALIIVMRFKPEGLLPSTRRRLELHTDTDEAPLVTVTTSGAAL